MYTLSILDKSPIPPGKDALSALSGTVRLAKRADELGYHRFWVAEHHGSEELASSAPEVLISWILAKTSRIRVGSGGVMLQHYSPYKVAEVFNVLSCLAPDRIDLGVGKTPGGLPRSTEALQVYYKGKPGFTEQLGELNRFLDAAQSQERGDTAFAGPCPKIGAERFLLGASPESAQIAADFGWNFVFAGHLNGDEDNLKRSLDLYRQASGGRSPVVALAVYAAENAKLAAARVAELKIFKITLETGQSQLVGSLDRAKEFARQAGVEDYKVEERIPAVLYGTPATIRAELGRLSATYGIEEFVLDPPVVDAQERLACIELLAPKGVTLAA
ncbi:MsnO8 family LLM class oxidoreductase [Rhizobium puerariae]|uniref:MsnO8 family LLM class oxidoreductase n=1 Tax=Rhizobium puerariae TaxID=1585791 RepID=A0ABV6AJD8_9HYPH